MNENQAPVNHAPHPSALPTQQRAENPRDQAAVLVLTLFFFMVLTALGYTLYFEWPRYAMLLGWKSMGLHVWEKVTIGWLLYSKTLMLFLPLYIVVAIAISCGYKRLSTVMLGLGWSATLLLLSVDLTLMTYAGTHLREYWPYIEEMLKNPSANHAQWIGGGVVEELSILLVGIALIGLISHRIIKRAVAGLAARGFISTYRTTLRVGVVGFVFLIAAVIPVQGLFSYSSLLIPVYEALPVNASMLSPRIYHYARAWSPSYGRNGSKVTLENNWEKALDLTGCRIQDAGGTTLQLHGRLGKGESESFDLPRGTNLGSHVFLVAEDGRIMTRLKMSFDGISTRLIVTRGSESSGDADINVDREQQTILRRLEPGFVSPAPVDPDATVQGADLPNVILVVIESFRADSVNPGLMARLHQWSEKGLRSERHHSGSNCSQLGLFSLFYGRDAAAYYRTLDERISPQLLKSMRRSGYRCTYISTCDLRGFWRISEFLNEDSLDRILIVGPPYRTKGYQDWPEGDRLALSEVRKIVDSSLGGPEFIFTFLMSTHYPYAFEPKYDMHRPSELGLRVSSNEEHWEILRNRYRNSALFLEDQLLKLIESLDPQRNLVIITGDHGESIKDDGTIGHGTRASEAQTSVPFLMVGPGIKPVVIDQATSHMDLLPTLLHALAGKRVPVKNSHGRDLLEPLAGDNDVTIVTFARELLLLRGNQRLLFKLSLKNPRSLGVYFKGLCDSKGLTSGNRFSLY